MKKSMTHIIVIFFSLIIASIKGCSIEGVTNWWLDLNVLDVDRGIFFQGAVTDITGIQSAVHSGDDLNGGPYFNVSIEDSLFILSLNENFANYEEYETSQSMSISVEFACNPSSTWTAIFIVSITDTNNNPPQFTPQASFDFTITPPLPPGYLLTGCLSSLNTRDIDLTTQRIEFSIEDNEWFEIAYDDSAATEAKNFQAVLRTKTFIRSFPDLVTLTIGATDVDLTSDPALTTYTTLRVTASDEFVYPEELVFSRAFYLATYSDTHTLTLDDSIYLEQGYDENVTFSLSGDFPNNFLLTSDGNNVFLAVTSPLPSDVIEGGGAKYLVVHAERLYTSGAVATVVVQLPQVSVVTSSISFDQLLYTGTIENNNLSVPHLQLTRGYEDGFNVSIEGDLSSYFSTTQTNNIITLVMSPLSESVTEQEHVINLQVSAYNTIGSATAVVSLELLKEIISTPQFEKRIYSASYDTTPALYVEEIVLSQGYDETVSFYMEGEHEAYFSVFPVSNVVRVELTSVLPEELLEQQRDLMLSLVADKPGTTGAHATVAIALPIIDFVVLSAEFDKGLYEGVLELGVVQHESIAVSGYNGTELQLSGTYASLFVSEVSDGMATIRYLLQASLPEDVTYVALELRADEASAALVLNVVHSSIDTSPPIVTFQPASYEISVDAATTGVVARVSATATNGEILRYSLDVDNDALVEKLSINDYGDIRLSSPASIGFHVFSVTATTLVTQVASTAPVRMTVHATAQCDEDNDLALSPLIVLDKDEEEPHRDLVPLDPSSECYYEMNNKWPLNQNWLYVDETGLHTNAIDREDPSIANMALSQVQVELILHCNAPLRKKRSIDAVPQWLTHYDYENSSWIITETIQYNPGRSLVNLIVNDINDNAPIFDGKHNEPLVAGYPVSKLLDFVEPDKLIQLKASDADIGINADIVYWSSAPQLAVSPLTGNVHVRDNFGDIADGTVLTVHATDQQGDGLTGDIDIVIRRLDEENIAVVTVRNAFHEDEDAILANLTNTFGYEVKSIKSTVNSDVYENTQPIMTREAVESRGASLKMYLYGVVNKNPVAVTQLIGDLNSNESVVIAMSLSLADYLEEREICAVPDSGRDTVLLVTTIVLSILLFILIVLISLWFFLRWKNGSLYEKFSDANSLVSTLDGSGEAPKPEVTTRPNVDVAEIKKTERRLQKMLDAPLVTESNNKEASTQEERVNVQVTKNNAPIVIQAIDKLKDGHDIDEDEFGERKMEKRKSVVTFNENVEKIIHLEDSGDDQDSINEVLRL